MSALLAVRGAMIAALAIAASCGGDADDRGASTVGTFSSSGVASSAVSTTASNEVPTLFTVSAEALRSQATAASDVARRVGDALVSFDLVAAPPTSTDFVVIDPADTSLRLYSLASYLGFLEAHIDTTQEVIEILVNVDGSLTWADWTNFFHVDVAEYAGPMRFARQLRVADGSVTQLMHLMDAAGAAEHAQAIARTIGYPGLGVPFEEIVAAIEAEAAQARELSERWVAAWSSADLVAIRSLYTADVVRVDGFAGGDQDLTAVQAWATTLFAIAPDLQVTATDVLASGIGPGALANMTATVAGSPCTVRMGVVWEVGGDGRIGREDVYYDAGSLLECGWVR